MSTRRPKTSNCTKGRWKLGINSYGQFRSFWVDCDMWSCEACRVRKAGQATAGARVHLMAGGTAWKLNLPDTAEKPGSDLRDRVEGRADRARKRLNKAGGADPLLVAEYVCMRRPGGSLETTSMNFGAGRKPPSLHDLLPIADREELEALVEHWFRSDGLRTEFAIKGTSDLRTSASAKAIMSTAITASCTRLQVDYGHRYMWLRCCARPVVKAS